MVNVGSIYVGVNRVLVGTLSSARMLRSIATCVDWKCNERVPKLCLMNNALVEEKCLSAEVAKAKLSRNRREKADLNSHGR